jgi:hypothetical protein
VTAPLVESWCAAGGDKKLAESGVDPGALVEETVQLARVSQPALEHMVDWWLDGFDPSD